MSDFSEAALKGFPQVDAMTQYPHVEWSPELERHVVVGSRVPVTRLWSWHRKGVAVETLVRRYPSLGWARVLGALSWAHDHQVKVEEEHAKDLAILYRGR